MTLIITLIILIIIFLLFFLKAIYLKKKIMLPYIKKKNNKPYIFFFYTDWCLISSSCQKKWIKLRKNYNKYFIFIDINVDKQKKLAEKFKVNNYPTFIYINNNKIEKYYGKQEFNKLINKIMK